MLFFFLRHGDPIYNPDSLTPQGEKQAEALSKRLALYGLDKIYSSTSNRAYLTAVSTAELLGKEITKLDFANEFHAWKDFTLDFGSGRRWIFHDERCRELFSTPELISLGEKWYEHPDIKDFHFEKGIERISREADGFFASLGYEHINGSGKYKVIDLNDERVALFAHQGFGLAFLSCMLDIPYPMFVQHFDICHTGMTVIEFKEQNGYVFPKVLMLSSDSHLYKEGLPTNYNNRLLF